MNEKIRVYITEEQVARRIDELAAQINADYGDEPLHIIGVLKGSVFFVCELSKRLKMPVTIDFLQVSSYGDGTKSSGVVRFVKDTDESIAGKNVLVVEDIIDSGRTLAHLSKLLVLRGPKTLNLCTLLDKPSRRVVEVDVRYKGFEIPDEFVIGFGLDYAQKYRNLPYIGILELGGEA